MSYNGGTGGGAELDAITFSDECIPSFVSLNPSMNNVEAEAYVP